MMLIYDRGKKIDFDFFRKEQLNMDKKKNCFNVIKTCEMLWSLKEHSETRKDLIMAYLKSLDNLNRLQHDDLYLEITKIFNFLESRIKQSYTYGKNSLDAYRIIEEYINSVRL